MAVRLPDASLPEVGNHHSDGQHTFAGPRRAVAVQVKNAKESHHIRKWGPFPTEI